MKSQTINRSFFLPFFRLPSPGIHPTDESAKHELYLMCNHIHETVAALESKGVKFTSPDSDQDYGLMTSIQFQGGGELEPNQPKHPTALPTPN